jgi:hypothetical protein
MTATKPSETARGQGWLANFLVEDRPVAELLLDSLEFVRTSTMRPALRKRLEHLAESGEIEQPAVLAAAMSIEDLKLGTDRPVAYTDGFETLAVPIDATPGSEGFVGNLIRDLLRTGDGWLPPSAALGELRTKRCRSIVVVTDWAGSGTQLSRYALTLTRHPTLRSWRSGELLRVHGVAYAATQTALAHVEEEGSAVDRLWMVRVAPSFADRPWSPADGARVEDLCKRYGRGRSDALGFLGSRSLFATDTTAPNNLPAVLRLQGSGWRPFFDGRTVPPDLVAELGDYCGDVTFAEIVSRAGQTRLATVGPAKHSRRQSGRLLEVLAMLGRRPRSSIELAATLMLDIVGVDGLVDALRVLGLIDEHHRVTPAGRAELHAGKQAVRHVTAKLVGSSEPYYPHTMR